MTAIDELVANNPPQTTATESGTITLDALLLTYVGAPLGSRDTSTYTISKDFSSTFRLTSESNRTITLMPSVTVTAGNFTAGGSVTFSQANSSQVSNAIVLRRSLSQGITTPAPGIAANTILLGLRRPQIQLDGDEKRLQFRFLKALDTFAFTVADLQNNPSVRALFKPETIASFLKQYVPLTDPTGASLVKPRFRLKQSIALSANVRDVFTLTASKGASASESNKSTTSVTITESIGFKPNSKVSLALKADQKIEFSHTAAQEMTANRILTVSTTINRAAAGITKVFFDKVFKTFVIIDAGPLDPSQPTVQGRVTNASGAAVAGALVKLTRDGVDYAAIADANGNYVIQTARNEPLASGTYELTCGDVKRSVTVGTGVTKVDVSRVNPTLARNRQFDTLDT